MTLEGPEESRRIVLTEFPTLTRNEIQTNILPLVMILGCFSSSGSTFYFNQSDPGSDVRIFATNIISVPGRLQQSIKPVRFMKPIATERDSRE